MKTVYVGQFTAKERASGSTYENEFGGLHATLTTAELQERTVKRTARARAIKEQNYRNRASF